MGERTRRVLAAFAAAYPDSLPRHPNVVETLTAVLPCKTVELGGSEYVCPDGHSREHVFMSCKEPVCPVCAGWARYRFVAQVEKIRLDCPVMHVVVTLDGGLRGLWESNRAAVTDVLFDAAMSAVTDLMADPDILGVTPGIVAVLHTSGSGMSLHIHVHLIVTRGGLAPDGSWRQLPTKWFAPYDVLSAFVRSKMLRALKRMAHGGELYLPAGQSFEDFYTNTLEPLYKKAWNVYVGTKKASPTRLFKYVSKGLYGGPIGDRDVIAYSHDSVRVRSRRDPDAADYEPAAADGRPAAASYEIPLRQFGDRWLLHVMPKNFKRVRRRGLYANASQDTLNLARIALHQFAIARRRKHLPALEVRQIPDERPVRCCRACGQIMCRTHIAPQPKRRLLAMRPAGGGRAIPPRARAPTPEAIAA
jgi:hypothetical protein